MRTHLWPGQQEILSNSWGAVPNLIEFFPRGVDIYLHIAGRTHISILCSTIACNQAPSWLLRWTTKVCASKLTSSTCKGALYYFIWAMAVKMKLPSC